MQLEHFNLYVICLFNKSGSPCTEKVILKFDHLCSVMMQELAAHLDITSIHSHIHRWYIFLHMLRCCSGISSKSWQKHGFIGMKPGSGGKLGSETKRKKKIVITHRSQFQVSRFLVLICKSSFLLLSHKWNNLYA